MEFIISRLYKPKDYLFLIKNIIPKFIFICHNLHVFLKNSIAIINISAAWWDYM
jgi:hypothetical protein